MLDREPDIGRRGMIVIEAWADLQRRQVGLNGPGSIPYEAIVLWGKERGLDREARVLLVDAIMHLDASRNMRKALVAEE